MKCQKCGYESNSKFCPECGSLIVQAVVCPNCGTKTDSKFCPNCGKNLVGELDSASRKEEPRKKRSSVRKWAVIVAVIILIAVLLGVVVALLGRKTPQNTDISLGTINESYDKEKEGEEPLGLGTTKSEGTLPGGVYIIGEDIPAGKYNFNYLTEMSEEDYWSNDYFYITRSGSKGSNETLGGTKYDERFGSVDYEAAQLGKAYYANLKKGDRIEVESNYGIWNYSSDADVSKVDNKGNELAGGVYVVGDDIAPGKYSFIYETQMPEDDYWSNDYFYITRSGSSGNNETLGGMKYDERFGDVAYIYASAGKEFYVNLKAGDKIEVESEYGKWTY